nr:putative structural protein [uncultured Mediterranean phage uvMED]
MPILNDRITDQIHELLPEYMNEEGQGFKQFITAYFDFLEKGILIFEQGTDLEKIGLEDGEGSVLQETETFSPSPLDKAKLLFEQNAVGQTQTGSWEIGEYVVGSTSGATARIDVLATEDNKLYVETFTESQFLPAETIVGQNSGYTAKVNKFEGGALFAANNLLDYADVDKTTGDFLEYFRRDFMPSIDSKIIADKRLLAKHINNIYLTKGSMASYDFLFRVLYNEDIEVSYPRDNMIKPSDSKWTESTVLNLHSTKNLLEYSQGKIVKRNNEQDIITEIQADTITRATSGEGDNVYQVVIMEPYTGSLLIGDTIELQSRTNPLKFHNATVRGIVSDMDETSGAVLIKMESGTGFVSSESDDSEGFQLETATDSLVAGTNNLILLETATQTDNSINEVHGKTPIIVRETVNTVNTEAVIGGAMKSEEASTGSLYTQSENVVVNLPQSELGVGQAAKALVGNVEDSKIEKVIIDPAVRGTGYNDGDIVVFDNTGSGGTLAQGEVTSISGDILLESGTTFGSFEFTATSGQTTFSGRDKHNSLLVYDPDKVLVRVKRSDASQTIASQGGGVSFSVFEEVRGSANVGLNGQSIVFTGTYAQNGHANYVGQAGTVIEVFAEPEETTLILEDGLQSTGENKLLFDQSGANPTGAIARVRITTSGIGYTSLPKAYVGGEVFYSETTTPNFTIGETITSGTTTGILVDHDKGARKLVIGKLQTTTDTTTFTVGSTLTGSASGATATSIQNSFTTGVGARLLPYGDSIGSIGKLRVIESGNHFNKSQGIPNYAHHFIIGRMSANPVAGASVTGSISNATATIQSFNGDTGVISLEDITGFFKLGEDVTVSDGKTFTILEGNPATVSAKNSPISKVDGNYTSDVGFPSVTAQRIQDSLFYQDFSYVIKVGQSINKYRSVVQQLLNPAGTIFFGEVAISNKIDGSAETYRSGSNTEGFDGDRITRSFIPTLYIGSKIDPAKIILEEGTVASGEEDVFYAEEQNVILESGDGVAVTERFLADDRLSLTVSTTGMSPAGSTTFTVGETVSQNVFKTASGDVATITGRVVSSNSTTLVVDQIRPDNTAIKQLISEGGRGGIYGLFMETGGAWKTAQSNTDITFVHGIVGASSGAKAIVNGVVDASVKTDQGSGQAFIVGEDITESDVGLYDRIIRANVTAHGHEVVKEVDILPHYAHTRLYYTTLNNAITIGQTVKGASSGKLGRVMEHDTVNKFIIVWEGSDSLGANLGSFTTEAITNESGGTTHFTATTVQEHHVNEGIVKVDIGHNSPVVTPPQNQVVDPDNNIHPPGTLDPNAFFKASEFYEGANRQQRKNITILKTFASANTKSGRTLTVVPISKQDLNQQGLRGSANATTIAYVGGLDWGETIKSATSDSIINNLSTGNSNHLVPSDAKRINSVANVDEEFIITEDGSYLIEELDHGFLMAEPEPERYNSITTTDGHYYVGDLWSVDPTEELTLEDGSRLALEDATDLEKHERFVTERSYNLGSYFMKTEEQDTLVLEDDSRLIQENAISFGEPVERLGPTLGDLAKIGFSQTLIKEENIIQEGGDDILMENEGGKLLIEAPYEGVKISDISTLYPKESVSDLQEHVGRSMILSHPASIHIDNGTALGM